jgi:hypothetical protein
MNTANNFDESRPPAQLGLRSAQRLRAHAILCVFGFLPSLVAAIALGQTVPAQVPLTTATVKETTEDVTIRKPDRTEPDPARLGDKVLGRDVLKTGALGSTADLEFDQNKAVYRLASGSLFSFDPDTGRLYLTQGLALMSIEKGTLVCQTCKDLCSASSTAILEVFTADKRSGKHHGCVIKFILLEGHGTMTTLDGKQTRTLRGGQMILQFEDDAVLSDPQEIDLKRLVKESRLITRFKNPLPSMSKIQQVIDLQQREFWQGTLEPTRFTIGGRGAERYSEPVSVKIGLEAPFDPDVPGGVKAQPVPCPICP